ncbi:protein ALP1-like [Aristolochia californica]|uniref:protein ALP1-like n=1 Tax=Aristolochia californica TaxID=171875 RepID=UPI0035DEB5BA
MVACTFDMQFTYILTGWEGSAADSRVLKSALTRQDKLYVPEGKYYLVDAGYANLPGFLAPYRGTRYHLQEFVNNTPTGERELFNRSHSSLRHTIEHTFGALKARFKILKDAPPFDFDVQVNIVIAYCVLHNYIRMEDHMDLFEDEEADSSNDSGGEHCEDNNESDIEDSDNSEDVEDDVDTQRSTQKESTVQSARASYYRDVLAIQIWQNY